MQGSGRVYEAPPETTPALEDAFFYHSMDLPESGSVDGLVDLRPYVDEYLGNVDFAGRRVLEIGPASGYLTFHMEGQGAEVVALEIAEHDEWDFVPQRGLEEIRSERHDHLVALRNGWWRAHGEFQSSARVHHGSPYDIPAELGTFDVAVMAAVLLHVHAPMQLIESCARVATTLVITDRLFPELPALPVMRLAASRENAVWDTWWDLTPEIVMQFVEVLGFTPEPVRSATALVRGFEVPFFVIVASR